MTAWKNCLHKCYKFCISLLFEAFLMFRERERKKKRLVYSVVQFFLCLGECLKKKKTTKLWALMFRQAVQSVVFWGHRTWQAVSEIRLLVLPDPLSFRVCVSVCVRARAAALLCSEGCKCNLRHMLLGLMFFRLMSVVISISAAETQECSLEVGLVHTCSKKKIKIKK